MKEYPIKKSGPAVRLFRAEDDLLSQVVESPKEVVDLFRGLENEKKVKVVSLKLDERSRVIDCQVVGVGSRSRSLLVPRVIVQGALDPRVHSIILVLNRPKGNALPRKHEREVFEMLAKMGRDLDFKILDLVIVSKDDWSSLADRMSLTG